MGPISLRRVAKPVAVGFIGGVLIACKSNDVAHDSAPAEAGGAGLGDLVVASSEASVKRRVKGIQHSAPAPIAFQHSVRLRAEAPIERSEYPEYVENSVMITAEEPVSTFSIDVDTASYSLTRASLTRGVRPPANIIRTEELFNYFDYD